MKTNFTLLFALIMAGMVTVGQRSSIELIFTAVNSEGSSLSVRCLRDY
jgi:hypothetical protein